MKLCTSFLPSIFAAATLLLGSCSAQGRGRVADMVRYRDGNKNNNDFNGGIGTNRRTSSDWNGRNRNCGNEPVCVGNGQNRIEFDNWCDAEDAGYLNYDVCLGTNNGGNNCGNEPVCVGNGQNRIEFDNWCDAVDAGYAYNYGVCLGTNNGGNNCNNLRDRVCGDSTGRTYCDGNEAQDDENINWTRGACSDELNLGTNSGGNNNGNNGNNCNNLSNRVCGDQTGMTYCDGDEAQGDGNRNWTQGACSGNTNSYSVRGASGTYTFQRDAEYEIDTEPNDIGDEGSN